MGRLRFGVRLKEKTTKQAQRSGTIYYYSFFVFFYLEKIRSWGTRSDMVRREQMDHNVTGEYQIYTSLFVS